MRDNVAYGFARRVNVEGKVSDSVPTFYKKVKLSEKMLRRHLLDAIFVRRDPPLDPIVLNFLDSIKAETVVLNDVDGIRKANNKIYTTSFHDTQGPAIYDLLENYITRKKVVQPSGAGHVKVTGM